MKYNPKQCKLCPRECKCDRNTSAGFCGATNTLKVAKVMLHNFEEPCISFQNGSGAIFFSGCTLKCKYCQNFKISAENFGKNISIIRLVEIFKELELAGADNINLITGSHFIPQIATALNMYKLKIPIVFNCGGYEKVEALKLLDGLVDIYLPDFKYAQEDLARKLSGVSNYKIIALKAIKEMLRQTGKPKFDKDGKLLKGTLVRHLVLPGYIENSLEVLDIISKNFSTDEILISLMSQFTPFYKANEYENLNRRITKLEYKIILNKFKKSGFDGYIQEISSANEEYTPIFDCEGVDN